MFFTSTYLIKLLGEFMSENNKSFKIDQEKSSELREEVIKHIFSAIEQSRNLMFEQIETELEWYNDGRTDLYVAFPGIKNEEERRAKMEEMKRKQKFYFQGLVDYRMTVGQWLHMLYDHIIRYENFEAVRKAPGYKKATLIYQKDMPTSSTQSVPESSLQEQNKELTLAQKDVPSEEATDDTKIVRYKQDESHQMAVIELFLSGVMAYNIVHLENLQRHNEELLDEIYRQFYDTRNSTERLIGVYNNIMSNNFILTELSSEKAYIKQIVDRSGKFGSSLNNVYKCIIERSSDSVIDIDEIYEEIKTGLMTQEFFGQAEEVQLNSTVHNNWDIMQFPYSNEDIKRQIQDLTKQISLDSKIQADINTLNQMVHEELLQNVHAEMVRIISQCIKSETNILKKHQENIVLYVKKRLPLNQKNYCIQEGEVEQFIQEVKDNVSGMTISQWLDKMAMAEDAPENVIKLFSVGIAVYQELYFIKTMQKSVRISQLIEEQLKTGEHSIDSLLKLYNRIETGDFFEWFESITETKKMNEAEKEESWKDEITGRYFALMNNYYKSFIFGCPRKDCSAIYGEIVRQLEQYFGNEEDDFIRDTNSRCLADIPYKVDYKDVQCRLCVLQFELMKSFDVQRQILGLTLYSDMISPVSKTQPKNDMIYNAFGDGISWDEYLDMPDNIIKEWMYRKYLSALNSKCFELMNQIIDDITNAMKEKLQLVIDDVRESLKKFYYASDDDDMPDPDELADDLEYYWGGSSIEWLNTVKGLCDEELAVYAADLYNYTDENRIDFLKDMEKSIKHCNPATISSTLETHVDIGQSLQLWYELWSMGFIFSADMQEKLKLAQKDRENLQKNILNKPVSNVALGLEYMNQMPEQVKKQTCATIRNKASENYMSQYAMSVRISRLTKQNIWLKWITTNIRDCVNKLYSELQPINNQEVPDASMEQEKPQVCLQNTSLSTATEPMTQDIEVKGDVLSKMKATITVVQREQTDPSKTLKMATKKEPLKIPADKIFWC